MPCKLNRALVLALFLVPIVVMARCYLVANSNVVNDCEIILRNLLSTHSHSLYSGIGDRSTLSQDIPKLVVGTQEEWGAMALKYNFQGVGSKYNIWFTVIHFRGFSFNLLRRLLEPRTRFLEDFVGRSQNTGSQKDRLSRTFGHFVAGGSVINLLVAE